MRTFKIFAVVFAFCAFLRSTGQSLELPVKEAAVFNQIDLDSDGAYEIVYSGAFDKFIPDRESYLVYYKTTPSQFARFVRRDSKRIDFDPGGIVGVGNADYYNKVDGLHPEIQTITFSEEYVLGEWFYSDGTSRFPEPFFTNKVTYLIGFRADLEDGRHYGWLRFTRPNAKFTTPFTLDRYDWHPITGASIGAGLPPEIPVATEVADDGMGNAVLRFSWHPAVATWIFETTPDLTPPIVWAEYPSGGTSAEIPLNGSDPHRYFRLRRP